MGKKSKYYHDIIESPLLKYCGKTVAKIQIIPWNWRGSDEKWRLIVFASDFLLFALFCCCVVLCSQSFKLIKVLASLLFQGVLISLLFSIAPSLCCRHGSKFYFNGACQTFALGECTNRQHTTNTTVSQVLFVLLLQLLCPSLSLSLLLLFSTYIRMTGCFASQR